jgi:hypothetical protein
MLKPINYFLAINLLFIPSLSLANTNDFLCSANGYTIATINGIFTNDKGAKQNKEALEFRLGKEYKGEKLRVDYLLNPSHLGGLGDIAKAVYQKVFDSGKVEDYDLVEMLKTASEQVRTQKLLLVAHSQGNFYANSFYDTVVDQSGGVPKESIGVYGIATPAGRFAGDGKWLTSDTDKVIADLVASAPFKKIMEPNAHIELRAGDDSLGHSFSDIYLKYQGGKIVSDIQDSLDKLSENNIQTGQLCIDPPKLTLAHKAAGVVFAVADPIANAGGKVAIGTAAIAYKANKFIAGLGEQVTNRSGSMLAQVTETTGNFVNKLFKKESDNKLALVAEIDLNNREVINRNILEDAEEVQNNVPIDSVTETVSLEEKPAELPAQSAVVCSFDSGNPPAGRTKLLINEVAWMGNLENANDEWIELKNISGTELDLSGWQVLDKGEQIKIVFENGKRLPAGGLLLLERTDDNSVSGVAADNIYVGALSNSNEGLRLFNKGCGLEDEVIAASSWPAGDNGSKRTMERLPSLNWHTYSGNGENLGGVLIMGTPKKENSQPAPVGPANVPAPAPEPEQPAVSGLAADHLVISEVQVAGADAGDEFIELYNPTESEVDLSDWSVQYLSGTATTTGNVSKKNFEAGNKVPAKGFFLIARGLNGSNADGYAGSVTPDLTHRTFSMSGASSGAKIFLVKNQEKVDSFDDSDIVDKLDYSFSVPAAGQSLERKTVENNNCVSAVGSGEFLGNGCDTDSGQNDFETRTTPNPQNTQSLPEPRSAPTAVSNFNAEYALSTLGVFFTWNESKDYSGATSTLRYAISYATSTNSNYKELTEATATTNYQWRLNEVGTDYAFAVVAKDKDGKPSAATVINRSVPGRFSNFYFYQDTRSGSTDKYLLEFYYDNYPFLPDVYSKGDAWKILVFYLNQEAPDEVELNLPGNWRSSNIDNVLGVRYLTCAGSNSSKLSLILPDTSARCGVGGGVENNALNWSRLEDLHLLVELATTTNEVIFTDQDFVSVGTYSLYQSGGGDQKFKLAALDRNKYFFQNSVPAQQAPDQPANLELSFNSSNSLLRIIWDKSKDADTLDGLVTYEINYSTTTLSDSGWGPIPNASQDPGEGSEINGRPFTKISLEPNTAYNIALRAKDDFGNLSAETVTSFTTPDITPPYGMADIEWGYVTNSSTLEVSFTANAYPFMTADNTSAIIFFLNQAPPAGHSFSNSANRWAIGGNNSVLKLSYSTCSSSSDSLLGGLLMHNSSSCPSGGSGLRKNNVRNNLITGQTNFSAEISGALVNGSTETHTFTADDYITLGFYERQGNSFQEAAVYNKKIYFKE